MNPLNTRFSTVLTTLAFLGFSVSAIAGKKCDANPTLPGCGGQPTVYYVDHIAGDMGVSGTDWESGNQGQIEWGQFWPAGTGSVHLSYFAEAAFTPPRGTHCFGSGTEVRLIQGGFRQQTNGSAWGRLWFDGHTDDGSRKSVRYMLTLEGQFADPDNLFPSASGYNRLTMKTWAMEIEGGGKRIRNISCTGAGVFNYPAVIDIVKIN